MSFYTDESRYDRTRARLVVHLDAFREDMDEGEAGDWLEYLWVLIVSPDIPDEQNWG